MFTGPQAHVHEGGAAEADARLGARHLGTCRHPSCQQVSPTVTCLICFCCLPLPCVPGTAHERLPLHHLCCASLPPQHAAPAELPLLPRLLPWPRPPRSPPPPSSRRCSGTATWCWLAHSCHAGCGTWADAGGTAHAQAHAPPGPLLAIEARTSPLNAPQPVHVHVLQLGHNGLHPGRLHGAHLHRLSGWRECVVLRP